MPLTNLEKALRSHIHDDDLILGRELEGVVGWSLFYDSLVGSSSLVLSHPAITADGDEVTVSGTGPILGVEKTAVGISFGKDGKGISIELAVDFGEQAALSLGGGALAANNLHMRMYIPGLGKPLSGAIGFILKAGTLRLPLIVNLPTDPNGWLIEGDFIEEALQDPTEFFSLLGQADPFSLLPSTDSLNGSFYVSDLSIKCSNQFTSINQFSTRLGSEREWSIIPNLLELHNPSVLFSFLSPFDGSRRVVTVSANGGIAINTRVIPVQLGRYGEVNWYARLATERLSLPSFSELKQLAGDAALFALLPKEISALEKIVLTGFEILFNSANKAVSRTSLSFLFEDYWPIPGFEKSGLRDIAVQLKKESAEKGEGKVSGSLAGTLFILGELVGISAVLKEFLTLEGRIARLSLLEIIKGIFDDLALSPDVPDIVFSDVDLVLNPKTGDFSFSGQAAEATWTIPLGIGTLQVDAPVLNFERVAVDDKEQSRSSCRISGESVLNLDVEGLSAHFSGNVEFVVGQEENGFTFTARPGDGNNLTLSFPTPVTGIEPQASFTFDIFIINHTEDGWQVKAEAVTQFSGLPSFMTAPLPGTKLSLIPQEPRTWILTVGREEFSFSVDRLWEGEPSRIELPIIELHGQELSLGELWLDVRDWSIGFASKGKAGKSLALAATLSAAPSEEINRLFGVGKDGRTPWLNFFKTYAEPGKAPSSVATDLRLNISDKSITAHLQGSPINMMQPDENGLYQISLGPDGLFGRFSTSMPEFHYNGTGWGAAGEFHIEEPLKLPFTPIKYLLTQAGLGLVAKVLPDAAPLDDFSLVENNKLTFEPWLKKLTKGASNLHIPNEVITALDELVKIGDSILERTPGQLNEYLSFEMPTDLDFAIEVAGTGGVRLDVSTTTADGREAKPIKLLLPFAGAPLGMPELLGIKLKSVSFGEILGGSLFLLEFDGTIDRFDLGTILICQASGGYLADGKTSCKKYRNSFDINKLLAVIPAGTPAPVPLFYNELNANYFGWEMARYETSWSFPQPESCLFNLINLFSQLLPFFTKSTYTLDPKKAPEGFSLPFTIGPNYIQLPPYIGGKLLGSQDGFPKWTGWISLANLLNGFKTGNPQDFLNALPLEARIGETSVSLGPFTAEAGAAVTTPQEFKTAILKEKVRTEAGQNFVKKLKSMGDGQDKQIFALLPKPDDGNIDDNGLIILLLGSFEVQKIITLQGTFVLAAVGSKGFGTGVQLSGLFGDALRIMIQGAITITPDLLEITGGTGIWWQDKRLTGIGLTTRVSGDEFSTMLTIDVTPSCSLTGEWLITSNSMAIGGALQWNYSSRKSLNGKAAISFSSQGLTLSTTDVGGNLLHGIGLKKLSATLPAALGKPMIGTVELEIPPSLTSGLHQEIEVAVKQVKSELDNARQLALSQLDGLKGYSLSVEGAKAMLVKLCGAIVDAITSQVNKLTTNYKYRVKVPPFGNWVTLWTVNLRKEAQKDTAPYIDTIKSFERRFSYSTKATLAKDVSDLLDWAISNKQHKVKRFGAGITTVTIFTNSMVNQLKEIKANIGGWVKYLPVKDTGMIIGDSMIAYAKGSVNQALSEIADSLDRSAEGVPTITGIFITTDLGLMGETGVSVEIEVSRSGKVARLQTMFNFKDPGSMAKGLFGLIRRELGGSLSD